MTPIKKKTKPFLAVRFIIIIIIMLISLTSRFIRHRISHHTRRGFSSSSSSSSTSPMFVSELELLKELKSSRPSKSIELEDVLCQIRKRYKWRPGPFRNGEIENSADENQASGMLLAWSQKNGLSADQVLRCYGKYYRDLDPSGTDHGNIREVLKHGMKAGSITMAPNALQKLPERLDISKDPRMSDVVIFNDVVYLSGQVPKDFSSDFSEQVNQTLEKIDDLLEKSGSSKSQILSAQLWIRDMEDFGEMNKIWNNWIDAENKPVRACVEAPMAHPDIRFEAMITAAQIS